MLGGAVVGTTIAGMTTDADAGFHAFMGAFVTAVAALVVLEVTDRDAEQKLLSGQEVACDESRSHVMALAEVLSAENIWVLTDEDDNGNWRLCVPRDQFGEALGVLAATRTPP